MVFLISLLVPASNAATLEVPSDDYTSIQDALDNADDGDEIVVGPGIWNGRLTISQNVTLRAAEGKYATTLTRGNAGTAPVVSIQGDVNVQMVGFTVTSQQVGVLVTGGASLVFEDGTCSGGPTDSGDRGHVCASMSAVASQSKRGRWRSHPAPRRHTRYGAQCARLGEQECWRLWQHRHVFQELF